MADEKQNSTSPIEHRWKTRSSEYKIHCNGRAWWRPLPAATGAVARWIRKKPKVKRASLALEALRLKGLADGLEAENAKLRDEIKAQGDAVRDLGKQNSDLREALGLDHATRASALEERDATIATLREKRNARLALPGGAAGEAAGLGRGAWANTGRVSPAPGRGRAAQRLPLRPAGGLGGQA